MQQHFLLVVHVFLLTELKRVEHSYSEKRYFGLFVLFFISKSIKMSENINPQDIVAMKRELKQLENQVNNFEFGFEAPSKKKKKLH